MALPEYRLATLKFVYTSKLRRELQWSVQNLRRTLEWSSDPWPLPQRLPRRAYRVSYIKAPFKGKEFWRHFVFHDYRYQFTFRHVEDVRSTLSTVLGSMTPETSCVCHFSWHFPGAPLYAYLEADGAALQCEQALERGLMAIRQKNSDDVERQKTWLGHSLHWNTGLKKAGDAE
mmetsp:Transcript_98453/g.195266  ORF Transcript_98453/g.195266 Transcript_98453/m.195266 type:complete len:174 (+) Transcript_98453:70-591(+)